MTLFDEYPETEAKPSVPVGWCCPATRRNAAVVEQFLHVLGHSRVPFTVEAVAELAGCGMSLAISATGNARCQGWIVPVEAEEYMETDPELFVGALARRR